MNDDGTEREDMMIMMHCYGDDGKSVGNCRAEGTHGWENGLLMNEASRGKCNHATPRPRLVINKSSPPGSSLSLSPVPPPSTGLDLFRLFFFPLVSIISVVFKRRRGAGTTV